MYEVIETMVVYHLTEKLVHGRFVQMESTVRSIQIGHLPFTLNPRISAPFE